MRTQSTLIKKIALIAMVLSLAACSTTRHSKGGDDNDMGGNYGLGGNGNGTYTEGAGTGGFQPAGTENCNVPSEGGKTQSYYFAYDSSEVHADDMSRLQAFASNSHGALRIVGNTDNHGSREYNVALGWRRANSVSSALKQAGVSAQKINTSSNGAEKPIAFGTSNEDYQCNRRVDVTEKG
jgi:peptidoglycan-associated lipoprotein